MARIVVTAERERRDYRVERICGKSRDVSPEMFPTKMCIQTDDIQEYEEVGDDTLVHFWDDRDPLLVLELFDSFHERMSVIEEIFKPEELENEE